MKRFLIVAMLALGSCKDSCNDCGPTHQITFSAKNRQNEDVTIRFFKNNTTFEAEIKANGELLLYERATGGYFAGFLSDRPYNEGGGSNYDSVQYFTNGSVSQKFIPDNCDAKQNPLCEINYSKIKDERNKNGVSFKEYRIILE